MEPDGFCVTSNENGTTNHGETDPFCWSRLIKTAAVTGETHHGEVSEETSLKNPSAQQFSSPFLRRYY